MFVRSGVPRKPAGSDVEFLELVNVDQLASIGVVKKPSSEALDRLVGDYCVYATDLMDNATFFLYAGSDVDCKCEVDRMTSSIAGRLPLYYFSISEVQDEQPS